MTLSAKVAFLGLGFMGGPMAGRLARAGVPLTVWNRSPDKAAPLAAAGARVAQTPAEAMAEAEFICLCLTDAAATEAVLFGDADPLGAVRRDAVVIDFATSDPASAKRLAGRFSERTGAAWLDAPVSGGAAGAAAGSLSVFAGGDPTILERAAPLLSLMAARITHMGGVGAGQAAKLCNQLIAATAVAAVAEATALADALGLDAGRLAEAFAGGFADSRPLQLFGPRMAQPVDPGPFGAKVSNMVKDIRAIQHAAAEARSATPLLARVEDLYDRLMSAGLGGADLPALVTPYRQAGD